MPPSTQLLAVLALVSLCAALPVRLVNTTFSERSYFFRVGTNEGTEQLLLDSAIATSTFDQYVYLPSACSGNAPFVDVVLLPCPASESAASTCIDKLGDSPSYSLQALEKRYFELQVDNEAGCSEVAIRVNALFGDPDISFYSGSLRTRLNFLEGSKKTGSDGVRVCCEAIRATDAAWNGSLVIEVSAKRSSSFTLSIEESSERVLAANWWFAVNAVWECEGEAPCSTDAQKCGERGSLPCCKTTISPLPPTKDALFVALQSFNRNDTMTYEARSDMIVLELQLHFVGSKLRDCHSVNPQVLETCSLSYPHFVNADGEPLGAPASPPLLTKSRIPCKPEAFQEAKKGFENVLDRFTAERRDSTAEVDELFYEALSWTVSDAFVACYQSTLGLLSSKSISTTQSSSVCPYNYWSERDHYIGDPCCSRAAAESECCAAAERDYAYLKYVANEDAVNRMCTNAACLVPAAKELANLQSNEADPSKRDTCQDTRQKALQDPRFNAKLAAQFCLDSVYHYFKCTPDNPSKCIELYGPDSYCFAGLGCALPCNSSIDCPGHEFGRACTNGYCDIFGPRPDQADEIALANCLTERLDPYISTYIREIVETADDSDDPYPIKLFKALTVVGCSDFSSKTKEECEQAKFCNWAPCEVGRRFTPFGEPISVMCSEDLCVEPNYAGDYFCAVCPANSNSQCFEISDTRRCAILLTTYINNRTLCESKGYYWNPLKGMQRACIVPNVTKEECMDPNFCPVDVSDPNEPAYYYCEQVCAIPAANSPELCANYTPSRPWSAFAGTSFQQWSLKGQNYSVCIVKNSNGRSLSHSACLANSEAFFSLPRAFYTGTRNTKEKCDGLCRLNTIDATKTREECDNTGWCTTPCLIGRTCNTKEDCLRNSGFCNDWSGCLVPHSNFGDGCVVSQCSSGGWTPDGCLLTSIARANCAAHNGTWLEKAFTQEQCESKVGKLCLDESVPELFRQEVTSQLTNVPSGYSLLPDPSCRACGRSPRPYFTWTPGYWRDSGEWYAGQWVKREVSHAYRWENTLDDPVTFIRLYNAAHAKRYASILRNELVCSFSYTFDAIEALACSCSDGSTCASSDAASSIRSVVVGTLALCTGVPGNISIENVNFEVPVHLVYASNSLCADVTVGSIDASQFDSRGEISLSAASIKSAQSKASIVSTVKNSGGIVVGKWIGDGIQWKFADKTTAAPIRTCVTISKPSSDDAEVEYKYFDLVAADASYSKFTPRGLKVPMTNVAQLCVDLEPKSPAYFPAVLIEEWESATFPSTWTSAEFSCMIVALVVYGVVFVVGASVLGLYVYRALKSRQAGKPIRDLPLIALGLLVFFILIRVMYVAFAFYGALEDSPAVDTIFSELPTLLFLSVCLIITLRWAEIYHYSMKGAKMHPIRKVVLPINAAIYIIFFIIIILYFALPAKQAIYCATPESVAKAVSPAAAVAYVYKALIAAISLATASAVAFYGISIYERLGKHAPANQREKRSPIRKLLIASLACCCFQTAQVANLISSAIVSDRSALSVIMTTLILEVFGAGLILFLFGPTSLFTRARKEKLTKTGLLPTPGTPGGSFPQQPSSLAYSNFNDIGRVGGSGTGSNSFEIL